MRGPDGATRHLRVSQPVPVEGMEAIAGTRFAPEPARAALEVNLGRLTGYTWFR